MTMECEKIYEGKLSPALAMAVLGHPHLVITQVGEGGLECEATQGFNTDNLFLFIKQLAKDNSQFRKVLVDYIIELSQSV